MERYLKPKLLISAASPSNNAWRKPLPLRSDANLTAAAETSERGREALHWVEWVNVHQNGFRHQSQIFTGGKKLAGSDRTVNDRKPLGPLAGWATGWRSIYSAFRQQQNAGQIYMTILAAFLSLPPRGHGNAKPELEDRGLISLMDKFPAGRSLDYSHRLLLTRRYRSIRNQLRKITRVNYRPSTSLHRPARRWLLPLFVTSTQVSGCHPPASFVNVRRYL